MELEQARQEIDSIDKELVSLFEKRLAAVREVGRYKEEHHLEVIDKAREDMVVSKALSYVENEDFRHYVKSFVQDIISISRKYQKYHMKQHVFLIGMPASGKTTVGRALSEKLNLPFYDLDTVLQEKKGKTIQNIIIYDGEPAFRQYELEALQELVQKSPSIIATGGGTILSEESNKLMRETGLVVFLHRTVPEILEDLDLEIRPLIKESIEYIFRLYEERYPLYERVCHMKILNSHHISDTVEAIAEALPKLR